MALWSALLSRPVRTRLVARPSLTLFFLLMGAFLLTLVPQVVQFPYWLSACIAAAMVLRGFIEVYRLPLPSTTFCGILAIILLGGIYLQYGHITGPDSGTAFTAGLLALKFYELRRPRDASLIIFSCFFVVMSALLYSQVLELFIYCLIMMWVLTALLVRVHTGDLAVDRLLPMLGKSGLVFLQAFPLALFLFFFFPRYTGPIGITLEEPSVGLTDTVAPGSIAKLSQDGSEAMYVLFTAGNIPLNSSMYWRALVLWNYQDGVWTPGEDAYSQPHRKLSPSPDPNPVVQEITIRPHNRKWLFALDAPTTTPDNKAEPDYWATMLNGHILQLTGPTAKLDHSARYTVNSSTGPLDDYLTATEQAHGIELPTDPVDQVGASVRNKAHELFQGLPDGEQEQAHISAIIHYFRHNGFKYSTEPGDQGPDWLSAFLLQRKTGFCEHFASAFAVLMRIAKIPTRLVVGYLGAEYNPYSDHYIVTQSDAHAWDEVWIMAKNQPPGGRKGYWMRVDPTALLAMAEEGQLPPNSANGGDTLSIQIAHHKLTFSEAYFPSWAKIGLKEMQLRREQVETEWDNIVFSYDPQAQNRLAQALGLGQRTRIGLLFACFVAGGICLIVFQKWIARKPPTSPVENLYADFCRNMARRGIPRAAWEGPLAYTGRVAEAFPDDKPAIHRVGAIVSYARYGPAPLDSAAPNDLKSILTLLTASQAASHPRDRK
jgi:transglutaminase-like putative cysteine protease